MSRRLVLALGAGLLILGGVAFVLLRGGDPDGFLAAPRPEASTGEEEAPALAPSTLGVPFSIPLDLLVGLLEDAVPVTFGSMDERRSIPDRDRVELAFQLERRPFQASMRGDTARVEALVEYSLRAWYDPPVLPAISGSCGTGDGEERPRLRLVLEAPITMTEEWGLSTEANLTTLEPATDEERDRCEMTFLDFDVTGRVVDGARSFLEGQESTLDSLAASVELRHHFASWWETIRDPIQLTDSVWLVLGPETVRRGPIRGVGDSVRVDLSLAARPRVVVAPRPPRDTTSLPPLVAVSSAPTGIDARVEGLVDYRTASQFLERELVGTELEGGGRRIRLEGLELYGLGGSEVALEVRVSGDVEARLFLTGTPTLDSGDRVIAVPDLDFDVATQSVVLEAASWVRGLGLRQLLQERARWPAAQAEDWLGEWLRKGINREVSSALLIRGNVDGVSVEQVLPLTGDLRIHLDARAAAWIELLP